ncbi:hypothetical protein BD769DRAFT_1624766 [Suillus cothurnatus]|nr:hypothetical protein BD769DRAFT_1624766 [Suillus cothurnatus]
MPNQWNPTSPLEEIMPHILRFWKARQTDKMIVQNLQKLIDTSRYGIGIMKFKEIRNAMGLQHTWQQNHSIESIHDAMKDMSVSRNVVILYFAAFEVELVRQWKAQQLKRRQFWAAGVNDLFAVDQHDKWLRFGLALHTGIEPFSGHIPMITQSDPGSENYGIANAHTMLHQMYDASLYHQWMHTKKNIMPEIAWSQLRCRFTPGYELLFDKGVESVNGVLHYSFSLSDCLAWYQDHVNNTAKRHDRNKVLPHGVPNLIYESPEDFGALDFKASVYVKSDHPVFDLVPQPLNQFIRRCYNDLGQPPVTCQSAWPIYLDLLCSIQLVKQLPPPIDLYVDDDDINENPLPLLENQKELLFGSCNDIMQK